MFTTVFVSAAGSRESTTLLPLGAVARYFLLRLFASLPCHTGTPATSMQTSDPDRAAHGGSPPSVWLVAWPNFGPPSCGSSHLCHTGHGPTHAEAFASPLQHVTYANQLRKKRAQWHGTAKQTFSPSRSFRWYIVHLLEQHAEKHLPAVHWGVMAGQITTWRTHDKTLQNHTKSRIYKTSLDPVVQNMKFHEISRGLIQGTTNQIQCYGWLHLCSQLAQLSRGIMQHPTWDVEARPLEIIIKAFEIFLDVPCLVP